MKWQQELECQLDYDSYLKKYLIINKCSNIAKLRSFQYRIVTKTLVTNMHLYHWGIKSTNKCYYCNREKETITHLLYDCPTVNSFWGQVHALIKSRFLCNQDKVIINKQNIIWNEVVKLSMHVANFVVLLAKHYIYAQRCKEEDITMLQFEARVNNYRNIEKYIAIKNSKVDKYVKKWRCNDGESLSQYLTQYVQNMGN